MIRKNSSSASNTYFCERVLGAGIGQMLDEGLRTKESADIGVTRKYS